MRARPPDPWWTARPSCTRWRRGPMTPRSWSWTASFSRLKVELGVSAAEVAADPERVRSRAPSSTTRRRSRPPAGSTSTTSSSGRSNALEGDPDLLARWRDRCAHLLVDEVQDVDRAQLRLALLLAAPANRIFLVGDDDQSIYGWRLADVRRILGLEALPARPAPRRPRGELPLPAPGRRAGGPPRRAQRRAVRQDDPRRAGGDGRLVLAPDPGRDRPSRARHPDLAGRRLDAGRPGAHEPRAPAGGRRRAAARAAVPGAADRAALEVPASTALLAEAPRAGRPGRAPPRSPWDASATTRRDRRGRRASRPRCSAGRGRSRTWPGSSTASTMPAAGWPSCVATTRPSPWRRPMRRRASNSTTSSWSGWRSAASRAREPSASAEDPVRAYEEERRLAYVAWTRARRSLTLLYDPTVPSPFLLEAFSRRNSA